MMMRTALSCLCKVSQQSLRAGVARRLSVTAPLQEKCINRVQLLGRVGRDPEQRGDAHPIVTFPLATTHQIRPSPEDDDDAPDRSVTTWHNITVGPATFRRYVQEFVTKGARVLVDGTLTYYKTTTPEGATRVTTNIRARELVIMTTPRRDEREAESRNPEYDDDDFHTSEPQLR